MKASQKITQVGKNTKVRHFSFSLIFKTDEKRAQFRITYQKN
jgi:hypothetical protein